MILNKLMSEIREFKPKSTERELIQDIDLARALYIKNKFSSGARPSDNVKQTLLDVQLEVVDQSEISLFKTDCRILKTKQLIPNFISTAKKNGLLTVRNPQVLNTNFNIVDKKEAPYTGNGRGNVRDVFAFLYNDYIYVKLSKSNPKIGLLTTLSVEGIFEEATLAQIFNNPDLAESRDLQYEDYAINNSDWKDIKSIILAGGQVE